MKRIFKLFVVLFVLILFGCSQNANMPNPVKEYNSLDEINEKVGTNLVDLKDYGTVTDEHFAVISDKIAEYSFVIDGVDLCFRGSRVLDEDISGIYINGNPAFTDFEIKTDVTGDSSVNVYRFVINDGCQYTVSSKYQEKEGELMVGTLQREDQNNYFVDLGRSSGILPKDQIIPGEKLQMGSSVKVYVSKLEIGPKGPFIMLSRSHYGFVKRLLEVEIPELSDGTIMLYSVAREAGSRTKIAVYTDYANVEPLGAVIGEKGRRIASVLKELNGEKIDVILYDKDPVKFIANALSPAKGVRVTIKDENKKEALAVVPDESLSLAIGRKGQNIKLASRLTHYRIEVKSESDMQKDEIVYTTKDDEEVEQGE